MHRTTIPALQPFREGRLANDNTHIAKVLWAYQAPWDINVSGAYFYTSGSTYTRVVRFSDLNQATTDIFAEPRGVAAPGRPAEVRLQGSRSGSGWQPGHLGVSFEGFNLFNNGAVNDRFTRTGAIFNQPDGAGRTAAAAGLGATYRF